MGNYYTPYPIRIPEELHGKIKKIASTNNMSLNEQLKVIIENYVDKQEEIIDCRDSENDWEKTGIA